MKRTFWGPGQFYFQNRQMRLYKKSSTFPLYVFVNIFLAISLGNFEIARLLLSSGANPTSKNGGGWSALHEAVSTGDPELVIEILVNRASYRRVNELAGRVAFMKHFFSMGKG